MIAARRCLAQLLRRLAERLDPPARVTVNILAGEDRLADTVHYFGVDVQKGGTYEVDLTTGEGRWFVQSSLPYGAVWRPRLRRWGRCLSDALLVALLLYLWWRIGGN